MPEANRKNTPRLRDGVLKRLLDARQILAAAAEPKDYYDAMVRRYPHRMNPGPVWYGATALLGSAPLESRRRPLGRPNRMANESFTSSAIATADGPDDMECPR